MRSAEIIISTSFDGTHTACISMDFTGYYILETMYYFNVFGFWFNWKLCSFLMCCRTKIISFFLGTRISLAYVAVGCGPLSLASIFKNGKIWGNPIPADAQQVRQTRLNNAPLAPIQTVPFTHRNPFIHFPPNPGQKQSHCCLLSPPVHLFCAATPSP